MKNDKTRGYYYFADGAVHWFYGISSRELKTYVAQHGKVIKFEHTN